MGRKRIKPVQATPFGEKLQVLRQNKKLSRQTLGQAVHVSSTYIGMLENGERQASRELVERLAQVLLPEAQTLAQDELFILAGFSPRHVVLPTTPQDLLSIHERAVAEAPHNFKVYSAWVMAQLKAGQFDKALELIQQGFQRFQAHVQLQSLLAMLELSKGHYADAVSTQELVLQQFQTQPEQGPGTSLSELLLNLGSMYFLKALASVDADSMQRDLKQACEHLFKAAQLAPDDVYIHDEYARACFNLACLVPLDQAQLQWQQALDSFQTVLAHPEQAQLGTPALREASTYIGLAYAKLQRWEESRLTLNLVRALCAPPDWLWHYVQACCLCLYFQAHAATPPTQADKQLLDQALAQLQQALALAAPENRSLDEAPQEADFAVLRQHRKRAFEQLIHKYK